MNKYPKIIPYRGKFMIETSKGMYLNEAYETHADAEVITARIIKNRELAEEWEAKHKRPKKLNNDRSIS